MSDITTTQIFSDGEKGITATKMNNIIANSVIQPDFVTAKPSSSTLDPTDQLLEVKGAGTYARITGQQLIDSVSASVTQNITPTIWSVRLRSFNAVGNPTFEVDQRSVGALVTNPASGFFLQDRWVYAKVGTVAVSLQKMTATAPDVAIPGTSFRITSAFYRLTLTTAQATLGASDYLRIAQTIEGPRFRELQTDVHSLSLLVRSSVAGLKFGALVRDSPATKCLAKLCTISSANIWTLIPLPNLPVWPSGNFASDPGVAGYELTIGLAAGTSVTTPANDTWQNGNFLGALGQDNFASKVVNSTIDLAFVQHEPGAVCSTPIDCPFTQNYDECLRYFCRSYPYGTPVGGANSNSYSLFNSIIAIAGSCVFQGGIKFPRQMAKTPTVIPYAQNNGAANNAYVIYATSGTVPNLTGNNAISSVTATPSGITSLAGNMTSTAPVTAMADWTADTGW
jgi:hypothetical protein